MESPSQAPHSGGSPWKGLLLTTSILSCWIQPTSAQSASVTVVPNPPYGTVGSSVILDIQGISEQPPSYTWHKRTVGNQIAFYRVADGQQTVADSRMNVFSNGSLLISNLSLSDTDTYIVLLINSNAQLETVQGPLVVYEIVSKPTITANSTSILEDSTLVITCVTEHQGINILWVFNNESLSLNERKYLSENNQTLNIRNVRREDAGSYQCEVWNPISNNRSDPLTLTVNYGPDTITFSPSPEGDKIQVTVNNPLTLVCQVESYPPAQYEWQVNGTVNSNFSDNMYTINSTSWEDSGSYTCLAWNNVTNISVSKDVTVLVEKVSPGRGNGSSFSTGDIAGIVIGVLAGVALTGGIIYFFFFRKTGRASKHHHSEKNCSAPKHGEDTTLYENTACQIGSAVSAQALDRTQVDVYEKISPWKNPQAEGRHKSP
ncbi:cell adhesion molecule CEACAM6-like isoform X2 [Notamacropus eugenii]|uniref:cell adhesion molecule CEACAM6-like isoform X2 n=1 Tax=Notamacropus eugenii TaxID=9315 RepID=UPI003B6720CF